MSLLAQMRAKQAAAAKPTDHEPGQKETAPMQHKKGAQKETAPTQHKEGAKSTRGGARKKPSGEAVVFE